MRESFEVWVGGWKHPLARIEWDVIGPVLCDDTSTRTRLIDEWSSWQAAYRRGVEEAAKDCENIAEECHKRGLGGQYTGALLCAKSHRELITEKSGQ